MAGTMDDMKGKIKDSGTDMRAKYEELKRKESSGDLDDKGRQELQQMRTHFEKKDI